MVGVRKPFNQSIENGKEIAKYDYLIGCLLDYPYFKATYKLIAIDLNEQQALDADPKVIPQINFPENLNKIEI